MSMCGGGFARQFFRAVVKKLGLNRVQAQHFSNSTEAAPMNWKRTELLECTAMFRCWITFMRGKTITLVESIHLPHVRVARGFCDY